MSKTLSSGNVTVEHGLMTFVIAPDEVKIGANIFIVRAESYGIKEGITNRDSNVD